MVPFVLLFVWRWTGETRRGFKNGTFHLHKDKVKSDQAQPHTSSGPLLLPKWARPAKQLGFSPQPARTLLLKNTYDGNTFFSGLLTTSYLWPDVHHV